MMPKVNFHTHTTYGDGKDLPEDIIKKAIELGFDALGFSEHAYIPEDPDCCMSEAQVSLYTEEISALSLKYRDKIRIYCGIEADYYSVYDAAQFEYVIGSVHYIKKGGSCYTVDLSPEEFMRAVNNGFDGDVYAFTDAYYTLVSEMAERPEVDIVGHFDLITKFNGQGELFSEDNERYKFAVKRAVSRVLKTGKPFEINTGAMSRGWRTSPYPSDFILSLIKEGGGKVLLSSDCHKKEHLDFAFDKALAAAQRAGLEIVSFVPKRKV